MKTFYIILAWACGIGGAIICINGEMGGLWLGIGIYIFGRLAVHADENPHVSKKEKEVLARMEEGEKKEFEETLRLAIEELEERFGVDLSECPTREWAWLADEVDENFPVHWADSNEAYRIEEEDDTPSSDMVNYGEKLRLMGNRRTVQRGILEGMAREEIITCEDLDEWIDEVMEGRDEKVQKRRRNQEEEYIEEKNEMNNGLSVREQRILAALPLRAELAKLEAKYNNLRYSRGGGYPSDYEIELKIQVDRLNSQISRIENGVSGGW